MALVFLIVICQSAIVAVHGIVSRSAASEEATTLLILAMSYGSCLVFRCLLHLVLSFFRFIIILLLSLAVGLNLTFSLDEKILLHLVNAGIIIHVLYKRLKHFFNTQISEGTHFPNPDTLQFLDILHIDDTCRFILSQIFLIAYDNLLGKVVLLLSLFSFGRNSTRPRLLHTFLLRYFQISYSIKHAEHIVESAPIGRVIDKDVALDTLLDAVFHRHFLVVGTLQVVVQGLRHFPSSIPHQYWLFIQVRVVVRKQINNLQVEEIWWTIRLIRIQVVCNAIYMRLNGRLVITGELVIDHSVDYLRLADVAGANDADPKLFDEFLFLFRRIHLFSIIIILTFF